MTIARIWGIPISVHVSWLLVFALVAGSLAGGDFREQHPEWGLVTRWALGALTSLIFFACVLVHELGHSRVALRNGIPIRGITLFVFGGVAQISREAASPGVEFRIAIAGPLTSLGLAGLFAGIGAAAGSRGRAAAGTGTGGAACYSGWASRGAGGIGLGLAICRGIITAHGERIWVDQRAGGGAAFRFTLPIVGTPPAVEQESSEASVAG